jgi:hypothetical protein
MSFFASLFPMHPVSVTTIMKGYIGNMTRPSAEMDELPSSLPSLLLVSSPSQNLSAPISPSLLTGNPNLHLLSSIVSNLLLIDSAPFPSASVVVVVMTQWHQEGWSYEGNI